MKILWIGKRPLSGTGGDEIFDHKTITLCRRLGHQIDVFHPEAAGRFTEVGNLLRGSPFQRARYDTPANRRAVALKARDYDVTICSWEPFDKLACALPKPAILILHNITSESMGSIYPNNLLASMAAWRLRLWEQRGYQAPNYAAVAALSVPDYQYLQSVHAAHPFLLPPGMPPCIPLTPNAGVRAEIVISGTYEWFPKKRDLMRFAEEYASLPKQSQARFPIRAEGLPDDAAKLLDVGALPRDQDRTIRFGLIVDRFAAGHKLKTLAYIANNQIVFTYGDVSFDFLHIPNYEFFIRKISSITEVPDHIASVYTIPADRLRQMMLDFQRDCAKTFDWNKVADRLMAVASETRQAGFSSVGASL